MQVFAYAHSSIPILDIAWMVGANSKIYDDITWSFIILSKWILKRVIFKIMSIILQIIGIIIQLIYKNSLWKVNSTFSWNLSWIPSLAVTHQIANRPYHPLKNSKHVIQIPLFI